MNKKTFLLSTLLFASSFSYAGDLSGHYLCNGFDSKDKATSNMKVTLNLDPQHSDTKIGYYSYKFKLIDDGTPYVGGAVSSGNTIAVSFANVNKPLDKGVGLAFVNYDFDKNGNITGTTFTKYYYEPDYTSHGIEKCVKTK